jgi:hypothetical protein
MYVLNGSDCFTLVIMRSLHDVHKNACNGDHVCLPVRILQPENLWTDYDVNAMPLQSVGRSVK